jgi:hypothetical protein
MDVNSCEDWDGAGISRTHLALRFKTKSGKVYTYDSEILLPGSSMFGDALYETDPKFGSGLTLDETRGICEHEDDWNSAFDRKQIPDLQSLVNRFFPEQGEFKNV